MIHVDPIEPDDPDWREWREKARKASENMASGDGIDEDLYKRGRQKVLELLFHGKCAYCEAKITADQGKGDVDHFRPKGRVRDKDGKIVFIARKTPHPGYYWLVYEWLNLLPACISCNRPHRNAEGKSVGKWDRFPLTDESKRARTRTDKLAEEKPLLLNPFADDPNEHLRFDPDLGTVSGMTPEGRETVLVLDLNRDGLVDERRQRATAAADAYNAYIQAVQANNQEGRLVRLDEVTRFKKGENAYSAIARTAIARVKERLLTAIAS